VHASRLTDRRETSPSQSPFSEIYVCSTLFVLRSLGGCSWRYYPLSESKPSHGTRALNLAALNHRNVRQIESIKNTVLLYTLVWQKLECTFDPFTSGRVLYQAIFKPFPDPSQCTMCCENHGRPSTSSLVSANQVSKVNVNTNPQRPA
jgi:hypothetical protein